MDPHVDKTVIERCAMKLCKVRLRTPTREIRLQWVERRRLDTKGIPYACVVQHGSSYAFEFKRTPIVGGQLTL